MPRPFKCRLIRGKTTCEGFKPVGTPGRSLDVIELGLDELEAIRLADMEGWYHDEAAQQMGVSRPTFGRLIERARHKVATALLGSKMLVFKGGPVMTRDSRRFECAHCGAAFEVPYGTDRPTICPSCQRTDLHRSDPGRGRGRHGAKNAGGGYGRCRRAHRQARTPTSSFMPMEASHEKESTE